MKHTFLALVSAVALAAAASALAQPGAKHHVPPNERLEQHLKELGLEPAQMERVRAILDAGKPAREEVRGRMRGAFAEMHALLEQDRPDEDAVLRQAERIGEIRTEAQKGMLRTLLAVRAELTPEQREQLKEKMRSEGPPRWLRERREGGPGL